MIFALPIPIVWGLSVELRQKITLSVVFTLGSMYVSFHFSTFLGSFSACKILMPDETVLV
jgi:hypothetical protein